MENMEKMENLLELKNVTFSFRTYGGVVQSVRDVSFNIKPGLLQIYRSRIRLRYLQFRQV